MRFLPCFALIVAGVAGVAAQPAVADAKQDECALQAEIVTRASALRLKRKSQSKTVEMMSTGEDEAVAEKYIAAVPHIVDWVYTLKRKQLKQDPGAAYLATCVSQ